MASGWLPDGIRVVTWWFQGGHLVVLECLPGGFRVVAVARGPIRSNNQRVI